MKIFSTFTKKFGPISLIAILLLSVLTACGTNTKKSADTSNKNQKVTINVWGMGEEAKSLPKMAKAFEAKYPNIHVNVQALPWSNAHDKLLTAVASKKGPDVLQMGTTWVPEFASANALMDLTPYIKDYPALKADNFYPGSIETTKYKDKVVGVPWYIDTRVLYYRKDLLKSVGYNEPPKTWAQLSDAAKKLAARGKGKYGISIDTKEQSLAFMFARQNGAKLFDAQGNPQFNKPKFVEAVKYLNSFFKNGSTPKSDIGVDIVQGFRGDGILPMFISGPWMVKIINDQAPDIKGKWATAILPKKENNTSALGGSDLSVFQYTKHKDAALKFVAFMSKPENQLKWMKLTNSLPAAKVAWKDPVLQNDPNYKTFGDQMEHARPMPGITHFEEIAQTYLKDFEQIYRGGANVQKEMDQFNAKAKQILNK